MPPPKKKVHARFNVGAMMSKLKEARERNALEHEKVLTLSRDVQSKQAKVRRLQQKVNDFFRVFRKFHLDFLISGAVNIAATFHRFHNAKVLNSITEVKTDLYKMLKMKYYQEIVWDVFKKRTADEVYVYL